MLTKLKVPGVKFPDLFVARNATDAKQARDNGLPFVRVPNTWDDNKVLAMLFWSTLKRMFPSIDWHKVLHISKQDSPSYRLGKLHVVTAIPRDTGKVPLQGDISDTIATTGGKGYREGVGGNEEERELEEVDLMEYLGTEWTWDVDIDVLQSLGFLPSFMDDIANAIRKNLMSVSWADGWNKKLDANMGTIRPRSEAPNLMVLDVSGSIPGGVALSMVKLIDTLRTQANADLIITGDSSWWYAIGDDLPRPEKLADMIGGANEVVRFAKILQDHCAGRHYGNLVVFGDDDSPYQYRFSYEKADKDAQKIHKGIASTGLRFDNILGYHTQYDNLPGYGRFAAECSPQAHITIDTSWVRMFKRRY